MFLSEILERLLRLTNILEFEKRVLYNRCALRIELKSEIPTSLSLDPFSTALETEN